MDNKKIIEKAFESSDLLSGGYLNPTQQGQFIVLVKKFSKLLSMVRFIPMSRPKQTIDKMHISEPISESAAENSLLNDTGAAQFNQIDLVAKKVRSSWQITTETLQANIEQGSFEDTLMEAMTERIATDMELLAIQGDDSLVGVDPMERLLKRLDGWDVLTAGSHIVDADGDAVSKNLFAGMLRAMPKQFKQDPNLRWLVSDTIANDWMNLLSERGTAVGDAALGGQGLNPFGRPLVTVPLIPDDQAIAIVAATPAQVAGIRAGPFDIVTGTNDALSLTSALAGPIVTTITEGVHETVEIARQVNVALVAGGITDIVASDNGDGQLLLATNTTGVASVVTINASTSAVTLGLTVATTTGSDAGTAGNVLEGSFILLTNPLNLIFAMLAGTRIFSEFNKDYDRIDTVVYNQVDVDVENIDAVVKAINVRREAL